MRFNIFIIINAIRTACQGYRDIPEGWLVDEDASKFMGFIQTHKSIKVYKLNPV